MFQVMQYNDDSGNRVICVGEDVDTLKAEAEAYHLAEFEEALTWTLQQGEWTTPYDCGMQYAIETVRFV